MLDESQTGRQAAAQSTLGDLDDVLEENGNDWQRVRPREIHPEHLARLEEHAREIFETLGMDLSRRSSSRGQPQVTGGSCRRSRQSRGRWAAAEPAEAPIVPVPSISLG